jgi:hypothetical protein
MPGTRRSRATTIGAFREAWRRVLGAPVLALALLGATGLLVLPLADTLRGMLVAPPGSSGAADQVVAAWDAGWAAEFASQTQSIGRTLSHEILGYGGALAIAGAFSDRQSLNPALATAIAAYSVLWLFLWGGILDRMARARPIGAAAFFGACGTFVGRFARLALFTAAAWWVILTVAHPLLFEGTDGSSGLYAVFLGALALIGLVVDIARIRIVMEDRHSAIGAALASIRFIRRRPFRVIALYVLNLLALAACGALWLAVAPAATAPVWLALLLSQLYLLARLWTRLAAMTSLLVFFEDALAHGSYRAEPLWVWPDSPSVEGLDNLAAGASARPGRPGADTLL